MPYITLPEQGYENPSDQIQRAAQAQMIQNQMRQQMQQSAAAFPLEQQQRQATASESNTRASNLQHQIDLQSAAQQTQTQLAMTQLQFQKETDPIKKQQLAAQVDQLNQEIGNIKIQGQLLSANVAHTGAETSLTEAEAGQRDPTKAQYNVKVVQGKPDANGNFVSTTQYLDPQSGAVLRSVDEQKQGRGLPRVAYEDQVDANGIHHKIPHALMEDPNNPGVMNMVPLSGGQSDQPAAPSGPDPLLGAIVKKFFDADGNRNDQKPVGIERAQLKALTASPQQMSAYDLHPSLTAGAGPVQYDGQTNQPVVTPAPTPGIGAGGAPVKTGEDAAPDPAASPAASAGTPIMSGRKKAAPAVSKFSDVPVGGYFYQGKVRKQKTSATGAIPVGEPADPDEDDPGVPDSSQSQTLPTAAVQ